MDFSCYYASSVQHMMEGSKIDLIQDQELYNVAQSQAWWSSSAADHVSSEPEEPDRKLQSMWSELLEPDPKEKPDCID